MNSTKFAEYYKVFNKLGYHTQKLGAKFFFSLLNDVRDELDKGLTDDEVIELIPKICVEEYGFYLEVGRRTYFDKITDFLTTRNDKKGQDLLSEISGFNQDLSVEESALVFAKYFNAKAKEQETEIGKHI